MTDLPLHLVAENATTITFGWEPPAAAVGYYFYADSKRVSNSTNGQQSSVRFKKVASGKYTVVAVGATATGDWPPAAPPSGSTIPAYQVTTYPGGHDAPGDTKCFCWVQHTSPTTQKLGNPATPGSYNQPRSIAWAPGDLYKPGDTVWILYHWKPKENDGPGRLLNLHTNQWRGGFEPGGNPDVSAVALDWFGSGHDVENDPGLRLGLEMYPNHHVPLIPYPETKAAMAPSHPGFDITLAIELKRPGLVRAWVDGVLKQSVTANTYYNGQTGYWVIAGSYRFDGITSNVQVQQTAERIGHSLEEAVADVPTPFNYYGATGPSGQPAYAVASLPPYNTNTFKTPVL